MNLVDIIRRFPTDDDCRAYLEKIRWPDGVRCPRCGHDKITRLTTRKQFTCAKKACRYRFSVTSDTIFHKTKIPLQKWFLAIYLMSDAKKSVSSLQLHRELGISKQCCWHMCMRIREAMREDHADLFRGIVQVDDYYHGGTPRKGSDTAGKRGRGSGKQPIIGAYDNQSGRIRVAVTPNMKGMTVRSIMEKWIDPKRTELHSDEWLGYKTIGGMCCTHEVVNHSKQYVNAIGAHCNAVENAWSLFARSVMGAFHRVSVKHLPRYLHEFESRFNARFDNGAYFPRILSQASGRRLPFSQLANGSSS